MRSASDRVCRDLSLGGRQLYFVKPLLGLVLLAAVVLTFFHSLREAKAVFAGGTVFAAQVIDGKRNLIAVFGDLSKVNRPAPAIKVIRQPLERLLGTRPTKGMRLAYVGIYNGVAGRSRWLNFSGWLVNAGTPDRRAVAPRGAEHSARRLGDARTRDCLLAEALPAEALCKSRLPFHSRPPARAE